MSMFPDYGTPGAPNLDPYYVSPTHAAEDEARRKDAISDLFGEITDAAVAARKMLTVQDVVDTLREAADRLSGDLDAVARDARRYRRLQVLGCAPFNSLELDEGKVLRFTGLDAFVDEDFRVQLLRGEAEPLMPGSRS